MSDEVKEFLKENGVLIGVAVVLLLILGASLA